VVVLDRFRSLASLGETFPHRRLCGHGFSGPITDLHARLLLALLCAAPLLADQATKAAPINDHDHGSAAQALASGKEATGGCGDVAAPESFPSWVRAFS
jgi:hypothetical protein